MDPFILSRNAFNAYCSEHINTDSSSSLTNNKQSNMDINYSSEYSSRKTNDRNEDYEKAISTLNQRYEYFLQTLDRLRISFERTTKNHNVNSISNSERESSTQSYTASKRSNENRLHKSKKRRMPKVSITVSCAEHRTQQQPNIKMH